MAKSSLLPIVQLAADRTGGATALADLLGISRAALYNWNRVPAERVLQIEKITNGSISRHDLRPDLYPRDDAA